MNNSLNDGHAILLTTLGQTLISEEQPMKLIFRIWIILKNTKDLFNPQRNGN